MKSDSVAMSHFSSARDVQRTFVYYEQPLSERIRAFLRLEYLFALIEHNLEDETEWGSRTSLSGMIEVNELLSRFDLRAELIKELERNSQVLHSLRRNPEVDSARLETTLQRVGDTLQRLRSTQCQPAQAIRKDELVYSVKQRLPIAGGTCNFDLPAYHFWLSRPASLRIAKLKDWLNDLQIIQTSTLLALGMTRDSAAPRVVKAAGGFFQEPVDSSVVCQLVRVGLAPAINVFPEISGGRHRFTIRFLEQPDTAQRPTQTSEDIVFELQCCNL